MCYSTKTRQLNTPKVCFDAVTVSRSTSLSLSKGKKKEYESSRRGRATRSHVTFLVRWSGLCPASTEHRGLEQQNKEFFILTFF